ncbi:MAG: hypothetical protein ACRDGS_08230 [Chloroflexota bacterium]
MAISFIHAFHAPPPRFLLPVYNPLACIADRQIGGALLRAAVVGAGRGSAGDREGILHARRGRDGHGSGAGGD